MLEDVPKINLSMLSDIILSLQGISKEIIKGIFRIKLQLQTPLPKVVLHVGKQDM